MPTLAANDLVYGLKSASDPQMSPDGEWVVYGVSETDAETHKRSNHLWISRLDGSEARQLTYSGEQNGSARWSPDGRSLAFTSDRDGKQALYLLSLAGGDPRRLVTHSNGIGLPSWSPDGTTLTYTAEIDPEHSDDEDPAKDAPAPVRVTNRLDYKYDGRGFLGEKRGRVFAYDLGADQERAVTTERDEYFNPRWSPDGRWLGALQSAVDTGRVRVTVIDPETGEARFGPFSGIAPEAWVWTPDSRRIIFSHQPEGRIQPQFSAFDPESGGVTQVTLEFGLQPPFDPLVPVWLDDHRLLIPVVSHASGALAVLDTRTGEVSEEMRWDAEHDWFSTDAAGRYVAQVRQSLNTKDEVVIHDRETGETRQITRLNDAAVAAFRGMEHERFSVERNGHAIDAWLFKPADFDESKQYPLVIDIHGGPAWWWGFRFEYLHRMLTSRDILVLVANPRGSASYGDDFVQAVVKDWGGEDYLDLMAVVDEVITRPFVDPELTGVYGYSYGGFMTSWVIGHTDRFKAAAIGAPVSDLVSFFGTSDIGPVWGPIQFGGTPWENRDWYLEHSPVTHLHKATTPSLILVSEGDDRCPIGQAEQVFATLKKIGVEAEFVRYPGGSHGMPWVGHPAYMVDYHERICAWFEQRLQPAT
jgi:dipeptidyl aminopeptidase/acylaminoacyl peptidase